MLDGGDMQRQVGVSGPNGATVSQAQNVVVDKDKESGIIYVLLTFTTAKAKVPRLTIALAVAILHASVTQLRHFCLFCRVFFWFFNERSHHALYSVRM